MGPCLDFEELGIILASPVHKFLMVAAFAEAAAFQDINIIRKPDRGKAVADQQNHAVYRHFTEGLENLVFGPGIHPAGGFIQNDQLALAQKGPGQSHFLPFALAEFPLVLKTMPQNRLVAPGQPPDKIIGLGLSGVT
jgi:hypothetical protein